MKVAEQRAQRIFEACTQAKSSGETKQALTITELPALLKRVDPALANNFSEKQQEDLFRMLDTNSDGEITVEEFTAAFGKFHLAFFYHRQTRQRISV